MKCIRIDGGGEFVEKNFKDYLEENGIQYQLTAPYTPQKNGVAERLNLTLLNSARTMLRRSKLPKEFKLKQSG